MKLEGQSFKNSDTCEGISFASKGVPHDIACIRITGRYPEQGWAKNERSHEMVYVVEGEGILLQENGSRQELQRGSGVVVEAGTWFAWEGDMTIVMACSPAFSPEQYKLKEATV